jgi:prepilin-type N-terminal cleavage/methylation domain-containing protein
MVTRRQAGFTATEILVVIGIVGVLAAIAVPSMSKMIQTQSVRSASYDLNADLIYARSEAISRATNVTITGASTTDFNQGWTITEAAGRHDPAHADAHREDHLHRQRQRLYVRQDRPRGIDSARRRSGPSPPRTVARKSR